MKAIVYTEIAIPSLRIIKKTQIPNLKWAKAQYKELIMLDKRRFMLHIMFSCTKLGSPEPLIRRSRPRICKRETYS